MRREQDMVEPGNNNSSPSNPNRFLCDRNFVEAVEEILTEQIELTKPRPIKNTAEVISSHTSPRYGKLVTARKAVSLFAVSLLMSCVWNTFSPIFVNPRITLFDLTISLLSIGSGLTLIILLISEIFAGAGKEIETELKKDNRLVMEYTFIPSLNRLSVLLSLIILVFLTIIFGFSSFYAELVRNNPNNFSGLGGGFLSLYFSIVTFSTVGYGDIHPNSIIARSSSMGEIIIAMFFSIIAISTTLSWVNSYQQRKHDEFIKQRVQETKARKKLINNAQ